MEEKNLEHTLASLEEIDRSLHQMLMLAELSAGEGDIDRPSLQVVVEHLRRKIDKIADGLDQNAK